MMILIKDLGIRETSPGVKKRIGIYECNDCKKHFECRTETVKARNQERCNSCASKLRPIVKHNMKQHPLNSTINNIIQRCENPKKYAFEHYGGRGISVCNEWKTDRKTFFDWVLANGWKQGLTIDRKDVNGNYEPENCRFVTQSVQMQNTRPLNNNNKTGYRGVSYSNYNKKYVSTIGLNNKSIHLGYFENPEEAACAYKFFVDKNKLEHKYE